MYRKFACALLAVGLVVAGGSTVAWAQRVERSGNIFHRAVCPGPDRPGTARCHAHVISDGKGNAVERAAAPHVTPSGYGAATLAAAYNIDTSQGSASTVIAIVDAYGYPNAESDLAVYRSTMGLPPCTTANHCFTKYNQSGQTRNYPQQNTGWAQETALDLDMASAMCPNCHIILVEANSATYGNLAAAENTAASLGAHVISNSYGGGESGSTPYESAYNHPGVAITVSSGDSGYGVQFPASSPHVTATGGTSLNYSASSRTETAWSGAGSGCSGVYAKPSWQTDGGCSMRMEADVSAVADPATGVAVYGPASRFSSAWQVYGGTSVAAPLVAGVYGNNGGSVNYGSNPYNGGWTLNDITQGSNGSCNVAYYCNAGAGYDGPTGLGTPNGNSAF
jgi:subtilase family serine protease